MKYKIAQVVVGLPINGPFDYSVEDALQERIKVGCRVFVSFGPRRLVGFIVGLKQSSPFKKLKSLISLIDEAPILDQSILKLTKELSEYYGCSWGEAIEVALPQVLRSKKSVVSKESATQENITKGPAEITLIHDQTNHKCWPFLMETIQKTILENRGVIFLVPENSLIEKIEKILKEKFLDQVVVLDRRLKSSEELRSWILVKEGRARIIIGTRSAIFAPVTNLGLIVIFSEDDYGYKQEQSPFYHAREVALMRSQVDTSAVIFVSRTPSVELWHLAQKKKIKFLSFESENTFPSQIVDLSDYQWRKSSILSFPLQNHMQKTLMQGGKILLFMNRKGFSNLTRCNQCGFTIKCQRCDTNLSYLYNVKKMVCRHCNYTALPPNLCPKCNSAYLRFTGMGGEKLESEVARLYPQAKVARFDRDTKSLPQNFDVLIATQAILKYESALSISLVGVLRIDSEINRLDFRSAQKTFSLLIHLKGIAQKQMIVQTGIPDNYCIKAALKMDFGKFYREELRFRRQIGFPPFCHLVALALRGPKEDVVFKGANDLYDHLTKNNRTKDIEILEPQADVIAKLRDKYRFTILIKGKSLQKAMPFIQSSLKSFGKKSGMIISVNVDP